MFSKSWQPKGLIHKPICVYYVTANSCTECLGETDKHGYYITKQGFLQDSQ